jgi:hypothetical protein
MKLKITILALAAAALTASAAFAAAPAGKGKPATSPSNSHPATPTVMFVLHGTVQSYTAVNGTTPGSVAISLTSWNRGSFTKGQILTFTIGTSAKVTLHNGAAPVKGDNALVKVRATKAATVTSVSSIFQFIDQGTSS